MRLTVGTAAGAALASKFGLSWAQDAVNPAKATARSVILLWMQGAPSQLDTFDLKPGTETGGPFKAIDTAAQGIRISEHLPLLAGEFKNVSLLRTVNSRDPNHETAVYYLHTGYRQEPTVERPSLGCLVSRELGDPNFDLPAFVSFGQYTIGPGLLGPRYMPFTIEDISKPLENVLLPQGVNPQRMRDREKLLRAQEEDFRKDHPGRQMDDHKEAYETAQKIVHSKQLSAFDLSKESESTRKAYGDNAFGKGCLTARRLVEAGVKFVEVQLGDWDTHDNNFERTKKLMHTLDPAMSSLVRDLRDRKLLDSTLVVCMGEFGRTPQINAANGRDHFTKAWSVALAGGGIQGGRVVGRTNASGLDVVERPVGVADLFATFYHVLGIDGNQKLMTPESRPVKILESGDIVKELL
jgi:hypothetical protein